MNQLLLNRQRPLKKEVFAILGLRSLYLALVGIIHRFKGNIDVKDESILNKGPDQVWPSMRDAHRALIASRDSE